MKLKGLSLKHLWWFSVPSIISSVFEPLASIVDTALVGQRSTSSLAALALAVAIFNAITWMFNFLVHASTQTIADYQAAKSPELLKGRIKIALTLAMLVGVSCSVILYFPRHLWFELVGGKTTLWEEFSSYFIPRTLFHPLTVLSLTLLSILRGFGRLNLVLVLMILTTGLNILLTWLFLFRMNLGLEGAAYGTILAHGVTTALGLFFVIKDERVGLSFLKARAERSHWLKFGKSSFDLFGRSLTLTLCFFISTRLASQVGVPELGAHQVLLQIWLLASFFLDGLAISGNILGARFYYGERIKRVSLVYGRLLLLGLIVGLVFTVVYLFGWPLICRLFSEDPQVIKAMDRIKYLVVFSQVISAFAFVFDGLIYGLGGFAFARKQMMVGAVITYIPFALLSFYQPQLVWIWSGLVLLNLYRTLSGYWFVREKVWKRVHL